MSGGEYPGGYPRIEDRTEYVQAILPDVAANGQGLAWAALLYDPVMDIDDQVALMYAGLLELEDAAGVVLDLAGDRVGESRGGLSDQEFRRIIAGRQVAELRGIGRRRAYAGWVALTGSDAATMEDLGMASARFVAPVGWEPSDIWLSRAGEVVRDLVAPGYEATALVTTTSTATFSTPSTPFGVGRWAYQLRVLGAS